MISGPLIVFSNCNLTQRRRLADDLDFFVFGEIVNDDVEHEPVELRFRQRIGSFQFDRVLRGENVKRLFENVCVAFDRTPIPPAWLPAAQTASSAAFG